MDLRVVLPGSWQLCDYDRAYRILNGNYEADRIADIIDKNPSSGQLFQSRSIHWMFVFAAKPYLAFIIISFQNTVNLRYNESRLIGSHSLGFATAFY